MLEIIGGREMGHFAELFIFNDLDSISFRAVPAPPLTSRLKEPRSGVSKDAPADVDAAALWIILRDARLRLAP